jgi:hypothetical protein
MQRTALAVVLLLVLASPAPAHHGAGTFDLGRTVTFIAAELTRVELINPHSWLYFDVTLDSGEVEQHRCEMRSAHVLRRSGWSGDLFPAGGRITLNASPDRLDPNSCYLQTILFADGSRMDRYGQYVRGPEGELREVRGPIAEPDAARALRRPTGEPNISGDWAPEQLVMADPRGVGGGLVPLGELEQRDTGGPTAGRGAGRGGAGGRGAGERRTYGGTTLTLAGESVVAQFSQDANPRFRCETTSILFDWAFDGPVNRIGQDDDTIVILYGQHGLERTIHTNTDRHPENLEPTRGGHSIGHWEDDVLVVDTVGFLPGVLSAPVVHSGQLHVVERFSLDPETMALTRTYSAEDPIFLEGAYAGSDTVYPADAPYAADVCEEQGFIDYSGAGGRPE